MTMEVAIIAGVGPGTGLMIVSSLSVAEIQKAIVQEDVRTIQAVKGIGAKTAQRIILELKDKLSKTKPGLNISPLVNNTLEQDALNALIALGIARSSAEQAVQRVVKAEPSLSAVEEIIKKALKTI